MKIINWAKQETYCYILAFLKKNISIFEHLKCSPPYPLFQFLLLYSLLLKRAHCIYFFSSPARAVSCCSLLRMASKFPHLSITIIYAR